MSIFGYIEGEELTEEAIGNPQIGDHFTEMYSFHLFVIGRDGDTVITTEGSPPVTFPDEGKVRTQTVEEFKARLSYGSIPGSWVRLIERGADVEGWLRSSPG